jgi:hypothetical protein
MNLLIAISFPIMLFHQLPINYSQVKVFQVTESFTCAQISFISPALTTSNTNQMKDSYPYPITDVTATHQTVENILPIQLDPTAENLELSATPTSLDNKGQKQKTTRPTPTPLLIPPPSDPRTTDLIIVMSIIMISVILFGLWINRWKFTKKK